ncbi:Serine protease inhibitor Kazal-type 5, partial [Frankliniella fusca]
MDISKLFDIGHKKALTLMKNKEDIEFYKSMQNDRKAIMLGLDKVNRDKHVKAAERQTAQLKAKEKSERDKEKLFSSRQLSGLSDLSGTGASSAEDTDDEFRPKVKLEKRVKVDVTKSQLVTAAMARTSTSPYAGSMMVKAIVKAAVTELGIDEKELKIVSSATQLKVKSKQNNEELSEIIKQEFEPTVPLLVHFDGKMFPSTEDADKKADRLPVVVSGKNVEKLLGIPELPHGSGQCISDAVVNLVKEWELQDDVIGLVFDTTATNSGQWGGACILIQQKLDKQLLALACRHHILELVLAAVFDKLAGDSKSRDIMYGDVLKSQWKTLVTGNYRTTASMRGVQKFLYNADEAIKFCSDQLQTFQPRDDYKELLELTIIFLGGSVPGKPVYTFRKPGATNKTRWMAKCLYSFKIWMLGKQLKLSAAETNAFFRVCAFIATVYVKNWFECPVAAMAPANDLQLLKVLSEQKEPHLKAAFVKMASHLWYLSEKLICLALFDEHVSYQEKGENCKCHKNYGRFIRCRTPRQSPTPIENFFTITKISPSFLEKDPSTWHDDSDFQHGLDVVRHLVPVNDKAERSVALITKYLKGNKLTNNENERQHMLQVVEKHRSMYNKFGTVK